MPWYDPNYDTISSVNGWSVCVECGSAWMIEPEHEPTCSWASKDDDASDEQPGWRAG